MRQSPKSMSNLDNARSGEGRRGNWAPCLQNDPQVHLMRHIICLHRLPASCSEVGRPLKGGPSGRNAPTHYGRPLHDLHWDCLHTPVFFPGPLTRGPIFTEISGKWWSPKYLHWVFRVLLIAFDEWTHQGCARMPTVPMIKKILRDIDGNHHIIYDHEKSMVGETSRSGAGCLAGDPGQTTWGRVPKYQNGRTLRKDSRGCRRTLPARRIQIWTLMETM